MGMKRRKKKPQNKTKNRIKKIIPRKTEVKQQHSLQNKSQQLHVLSMVSDKSFLRALNAQAF